MFKKFLVLVIATLVAGEDISINNNSFPADFLFGIGTSAYQTEGAWQEDGKSENLWDYITHKESHLITDKSNGDIACDSYHKFKDDLELIQKMGVNFYRFSLSWSRILPSGFANKVNKAAIDHYNNIIDELLSHNITPIVTLLHWDIPLSIHHLGGFMHPYVVDVFEDYARVAFEHFGDRVKLWVTINDPKAICSNKLANSIKAFGEDLAGVGDYYCAYNLVRTHARAYHTYNSTFREKQQGKLGVGITCPWFEPASNSSENVAAAERVLQFQCGLYAQPLYGTDGDFPKIVKDFVNNRSKEEGFNTSRFYPLADNQVPYVKGSYDFLAINHYTAYLVADKSADPIGNSSVEKDQRATISQDPSWNESTFKEYKSVPWAFKKLLKWLKDSYDDPEIYITENGFADSEPQNDTKRIHYHLYYLNELLNAIHTDKVRVKGYVAWNLLDSFEFYHGYTQKFGFYHVDFTKPERPRTPKNSVEFYSNIIKTHKLPNNITK